MGKKIEGLQRMLVIINKLKGLQRYVSREELERYVSWQRFAWKSEKALP